jgi:hypothetical protein
MGSSITITTMKLAGQGGPSQNSGKSASKKTNSRKTVKQAQKFAAGAVALGGAPR